jgi:ferredoxin
MAKVKIVADRNTCIGCGACIAIAPEFWEMDLEGKSKFKIGESQEGIELDLEEDEIQTLIESAESCPVNSIHIYKEGVKVL